MWWRELSRTPQSECQTTGLYNMNACGFIFLFLSMQQEKRSLPTEGACHITMEVLKSEFHTKISANKLPCAAENRHIIYEQHPEMDDSYMKWEFIFAPHQDVVLSGSDSRTSFPTLLFHASEQQPAMLKMCIWSEIFHCFLYVQNMFLQLRWMALTRLFVGDQMKREQGRVVKQLSRPHQG